MFSAGYPFGHGVDPRSLNDKADYISRIQEFGDWSQGGGTGGGGGEGAYKISGPCPPKLDGYN